MKKIEIQRAEGGGYTLLVDGRQGFKAPSNILTVLETVARVAEPGVPSCEVLAAAGEQAQGDPDVKLSAIDTALTLTHEEIEADENLRHMLHHALMAAMPLKCGECALVGTLAAVLSALEMHEAELDEVLQAAFPLANYLTMAATLRALRAQGGGDA